MTRILPFYLLFGTFLFYSPTISEWLSDSCDKKQQKDDEKTEKKNGSVLCHSEFKIILLVYIYKKKVGGVSGVWRR